MLDKNIIVFKPLTQCLAQSKYPKTGVVLLRVIRVVVE